MIFKVINLIQFVLVVEWFYKPKVYLKVYFELQDYQNYDFLCKNNLKQFKLDTGVTGWPTQSHIIVIARFFFLNI